jgi:hypothetical protein
MNKNALISALDNAQKLLNSHEKVARIKIDQVPVLTMGQDELAETFKNDIMGRLAPLYRQKGGLTTGDVLENASDYAANLYYEWAKGNSNIDENVIIHLSFIVSLSIIKSEVVKSDNDYILDFILRFSIRKCLTYIETGHFQF